MTKKKIAAILLGFVLATVMCGCNGNTPSALDNKTVLLEMSVGEEVYIKSDDEAAWKSATDVVTVETTGRGYVRVYAVTDGASIVTNGTKKYMISVSSLSSTGGFTTKKNFIEIDLSEDEYAAIEVEGRQPSDFTYTAANRDVVSVDENGKVRGRGKGVTYVTVSEKTTNLSRRVTVTVCGERNKLYAKSYDAGWHPTAEHVQGAETDRYGDYFYYSFADRLIKQSADGEVVGTVTGITGHMGDAAYNRADDKLYVSYTRKDGGDKLCYMLIFDCEKIDKLNMKFEDVCTCVYVGAPILELAKENGYDAEGNALSDEWLSLSGKYGVNNSIDSCTFGPKFGVNDGKTYLTMGLGAPGQSEKVSVGGVEKSAADRVDNDYQVIVQFDTSDWENYAVPFAQISDATGPENFDGIYFFYYGAHDYSAQNLCYDRYTNTYIMSTYGLLEARQSAGFKNNCVYFIDATEAEEKSLTGNGVETGLVLGAKYGIADGKGAVGYAFNELQVSPSVGIVSMHDGKLYIASSERKADWSENWAGLTLYEIQQLSESNIAINKVA